MTAEKKISISTFGLHLEPNKNGYKTKTHSHLPKK